MVQFSSLRVFALGGLLCLTSPVVMAQDAPDAGAGLDSGAGDIVSSREGIALQNQLEALRQQFLQSQSSGTLAPPGGTAGGVSGGGGGNDLVAQLVQRVSVLEEQNRQMRGEIDQLSNDLKTTQAQLSKQVSDLQFSIQNGGASSTGASSIGSSANSSPGSGGGRLGGGGLGSGGASSPKSGLTAGGVAPAPPKTGGAGATPTSAMEALRLGNAALWSGRYGEAESDARFAVRAVKTDQGRMDAQFLLAQSLAGQKQYRGSAVAYYDAYGKSPKSAKAQDSLLGVAASLLALGNKSGACQALDKLQAEFPRATTRVKTAATTFRHRAGCH